MVGGKFGGALQIVRVVVFWGQEKSLSFGHRRDDVSECYPSFLRGVGRTSSPLLGAYRGNPRFRPGSSVDVVVFLLGSAVWYAMI